jgi:Sec-independent protein translocase protein TatA
MGKAIKSFKTATADDDKKETEKIENGNKDDKPE